MSRKILFDSCDRTADFLKASNGHCRRQQGGGPHPLPLRRCRHFQKTYDQYPHRIFGSRNDACSNVQRRRASDQCAGAQVSALDDDALRPGRGVQGAGCQRRALDDVLPGRSPWSAGRQARSADAPFRRPVDQRHGAAQRQDRRNAHGRRNARRNPPDLSQCARRQGACIIAVSDYLAQRDAGWMGRIYKFSGSPSASTFRGWSTPSRLRMRQTSPTAPTRIRLRLPARQRGVQASQRAAGFLCDRRRGGLDPDRRSAHAADHLGQKDNVDLYYKLNEIAPKLTRREEESRGRLLGGREGA